VLIMSDDEKALFTSKILRAIEDVASGRRRTEGRDEVPGDVRVRVGGGAGSRALSAEVAAVEGGAGERRLVLAQANGRVCLAFKTTGERTFTYGDVRLEAPDRAGGAAFVAAVARWLGTPIDDVTQPDLEGAPVEVAGKFARLAVVRHADGTDWERLKVFLGEGDECAEFFLGVSADRTRVTFSEKEDCYRRPLVGLLSQKLGDRRPPAARRVVTVGEVIGARFSVPIDWRVLPQQGHMRVTDARGDCCLEVSCVRVPGLAVGLPSPEAQLRQVLASSEHPEAAQRIMTHDRGDLELAWGEHDFESDDAHRPGVRRPARARTVLAAHERVQILATFSCWIDDLSWAIPAWERNIDSLEAAAGLDLIADLAGGVPRGSRRAD
jgi:hypothetical protein